MLTPTGSTSGSDPGATITHSNISFPNNNLTPGDYTLKIIVKPMYKYLDYMGYPAVRPNGMI